MMSETKGNIFSVLQKIGKSLMMPVSVLPAAGLLVALGRLMQNWSMTNEVMTSPLLNSIGKVFFSGGLAIFEQLPAVFAVGVAIGFTAGAGVAGLASVVGYYTMVNVIKVIGEVRGLELAINTGVFGGILMGIITSQLYHRFYQTKLHPVLGFFSGKRLVPIVTAGSAIVAGVLLGFVWPPIQEQINHFGHFVMDSTFGPAFYAAGKRLLIPVGLHHVYYPPFLYEFGSFVLDGKTLTGETARYFAGDPTAGRFMAAEFPIMLFGLPAATLAMYLRAPKSKRVAIAGIMLSAALTSIITGITEPIEFSFIFVAPMLYVFHVLAAFVSGTLTGFFDVHLGYTFSASIIDFVLGFFNQKNSFYLFAVIGPLIALMYFSVFYYLIGKFDIKTPGRDLDLADEDSTNALPFDEKAAAILEALGGKENLKAIDACITRLRLSVVNPTQVDQNKLKQLGAAGIMNAGKNIQVIFGTESEHIKDKIVSLMNGTQTKTAAPKAAIANAVVAPAKMKRVLHLSSPIKGQILKLDQVPDETFAQKILGDGFAIIPSEGVVVAPADGKIVQLFHTNHAIGLLTSEGIEILIHIGIDTVKMKGIGFKALVATGDEVLKGDKLIEFDLDAVKQNASSSVTPIVITNSTEYKNFELLTQGVVDNKTDVFNLHLN